MSLRVAALMARHGDADHPSALEDLIHFYAANLPGVERSIIVCDNTLPPDIVREVAPNCVLIGAKETAREFSSLDAGVALLGPSLFDFDYVHLTTSAFQQLYTAYIDRIDRAMLEALRGRGAAIGHLDRYNAPVTMFGRTTQSWLRSSFMFLPPAELRLLGSLVSVTPKAELFSCDPSMPFRTDAPLDATLQQNILGWLTGEGTGQGVEWHSRFKLTLESLPLFQAKTLAILNELALTIRLREQGCVPLDATWLAGRVARGAFRELIAEAFPPWQEQLAERPEDAVAVEPQWR